MFGAQLAALKRTYAKWEVMSVPVWEVIGERQRDAVTVRW